MTGTKNWPTPVTWIVAILMLGIGGGLIDSLRHDFIDSLGYWGSLVAAGIALATAILGITLLFKLSWSKRAIIALVIPIGVFTYEEIGTALNRNLGKFPSEAIGGVVAALICWIILMILSKFLSVRWHDDRETGAKF